METTLALIKPDAVKKQIAGAIISMIENEDLKIKAMEMVKFNNKTAGSFYQVHRDKPFFPNLMKYMTSGPVIAMVLEGENAIKKWRSLMGATNPEEASPESIRGKFGQSLTVNSVHGSDAPETAAVEISYLFSGRYIDERS
ncbi:MAG: nucleoside-diphosphate kinase [Myxococcota bacterium]